MSVCVSRVVHQRSLSSRSSSSSDTAHDSTFSGGCGSAGLLWLDEAEAETTVPLQPADDAETLTTVATAAVQAEALFGGDHPEAEATSSHPEGDATSSLPGSPRNMVGSKLNEHV